MLKLIKENLGTFVVPSVHLKVADLSLSRDLNLYSATLKVCSTGKSFSEVLILASTNPQDCPLNYYFST